MNLEEWDTQVTPKLDAIKFLSYRIAVHLTDSARAAEGIHHWMDQLEVRPNFVSKTEEDLTIAARKAKELYELLNSALEKFYSKKEDE